MSEKGQAEADQFKDLILSYIPFIFYGSMVVFTILLSAEEFKTLWPLIPVGFSVFLLVFYMQHKVWFRVPGMKECVVVICVWTFWIYFGILYKEWHMNVGENVSMMCSAILVIIVGTTYHVSMYEYYTLRMFLVVAYTITCALSPSKDNVITNCGVTWNLTKMISYGILFSCAVNENKFSVKQWIRSRRVRGLTTKISEQITLGGEPIFYGSVERIVLQTSWILFVRAYFVLLVMAQIWAIAYFTKIFEQEKMTDKKNTEENPYNGNDILIGVDDLERQTFRYPSDQEDEAIVFDFSEAETQTFSFHSSDDND